jgi:hypothetical protein
VKRRTVDEKRGLTASRRARKSWFVPPGKVLRKPGVEIGKIGKDGVNFTKGTIVTTVFVPLSTFT